MINRTIALGATVLALVCSMGARGATLSVIGNLDSNNTADFVFESDAFSDVNDLGFTVEFTVTNTSVSFDPIITGIALTVPDGTTGFDLASSTLPPNWNTYFEVGGVETPQPLGVFDFCAESGNGDKNCGGGNPNDGIAQGDSFTFLLRFLGDFDGVDLFATDFVPLAARFQNTGVDGEGSDVAVCMNGSCDGGELPGVPEPSTYLLFGAGLAAMGFLKRRNSEPISARSFDDGRPDKRTARFALVVQSRAGSMRVNRLISNDSSGVRAA